jgi:hypothetical protein
MKNRPAKLEIGGALTGNLPLNTVLGPNTNAIGLLGEVDGTVKLDETSTKVVLALPDLGIGKPVVLLQVRLGGGVPGAGTETRFVGPAAGSRLEEVVKRVDLGVDGGHELGVTETVVPVDGRATRPLGTGDGEAIGRACGGRLGQVAQVSVDVSHGRHGVDEECVCVRSDVGLRDTRQAVRQMEEVGGRVFPRVKATRERVGAASHRDELMARQDKAKARTATRLLRRVWGRTAAE